MKSAKARDSRRRSRAKFNLLSAGATRLGVLHSQILAYLDRVLKASVDRVSVDTIGRYGDRHSADISTDTRSICRPRLGRVSVDMLF